MYTNNYYYKLICETLTGDEITGHHTDIYYLELILGTYRVTYDSVKCKGKYLKDWYTALTRQTVTGSHPNVYYLRLIANHLTSSTLPWRTENYYLRLISENIDVNVTVQLVADPSTIELNESTTLTATVLDADREPIEDASVTIYNGESSLVTDTTDENGQIEYTYTPSSVGEYELYAVYDEYSSATITVTVSKIFPSLSITTTDNEINVGDAPSMSGVLSTEQSGKSIKIYKDSSQTALATVTTSSGGAWSYTDSATTNSGTVSYYAVYDGDDTYESVTSSLLNIAVYKISTTLNITPPTILLDEEFDVVGNLSDANSTAISGATVTLNWTVGGVNHSATSTTDSNGDVTFHSSAPTTITTYTFQLSYAGSNKYLNSQSSQIEVNVSDTSTNLTVSRPVNDTRVTPTDTVSVSGYLEDTNGNRLSDKTIKVKLGSTVLATTTTGSIGVYSTSFNASSLSDGSNTITITFEGDSSHNSSTVTRTVIRGVYQISLSEANNKTILSYADSDTASLQATLTHGGVAVPDNPITFFTGVANTYNTQTQLNEDWSNGFKIRIEGTSERLIIGNGTTAQIYYYPKPVANNVEIITNGQKVTNFNCGDWLKYDNGVLYGSNGNSLDISSYNIDFTKNTISGGTLYRDVIGVSTTDNTGKATITYNSQGVGDIGFKAEWSTFVSETYEICDASFYDEMTSNAKQSRWTIPSAISSSSIFGYSNDGWKIGNASAYTHMFLEIDFNTSTSIEFQLNDYNGSAESPFMRICTPSHETFQNMFTVLNSNITFAGVNISRNAVKGAVYRIDIYSNQMKLYENDVLISTQSATPHSTFRLVNTTGTNRMMQWKNLIIKPLQSINIDVDNSILSYVDSETTTITATHSQGTGKIVKLYDASDDSLIATMTDKGDGTYTYTYTSQGVGDIGFYAKCGSIVSERFVIQDCSLYRANPVACTSCNIDLPSSALVSYKMSKPVLDSTSGGINIQLIDSSHTYFVGNWASWGNNGVLIRNTGSSSNLVSQTCSDITANTEYTLGVTYDNGDWTYFKDSEVKSFSANYTPTKLNVIQVQQGTIKDLIIKPL